MSKEYRKFCAKKGISISYSRKGNPYDNACIESFHATLKKEYVHNENFENLESLRSGMYEYIEIWYNNSRIHSKIRNQYLVPITKTGDDIFYSSRNWNKQKLIIDDYMPDESIDYLMIKLLQV